MSEHYGVAKRTDVGSGSERAAEEIRLRGYAILPALFTSEEVDGLRSAIDAAYARQESEFGREALKAIGELDICRAALLYDDAFIRLASHPTILGIARALLGDWIILHLQNAIINRPDVKHHQTAWHRDLPYQNWVISKPLAISALVAVDEFSAATGATRLLPLSHKSEMMPSRPYTDSNAIDVEAPPGSVIIFDSMLFHQAGQNRSGQARRAVNHVYTAPILKQQYDFPRALAGRTDLPPEVQQLLGFTSQVPSDDRAWRKARAHRLAAGS